MISHTKQQGLPSKSTHVQIKINPFTCECIFCFLDNGEEDQLLMCTRHGAQGFLYIRREQGRFRQELWLACEAKICRSEHL